MLKKSSSFKLGLVAVALVGIALLTSAALANTTAKNFKVALQATSEGCVTGFGAIRSTDFVNNIIGLGFAPWTTNDIHYEPDCFRVNLIPATAAPIANIDKDFRLCLQAADNFGVNAQGSVVSLNELGTQRCTPWASDGGGKSDWAYDADAYDPDGYQLEMETRALPEGTSIGDVRIGFQVADAKKKPPIANPCSPDVGAVQYTPWLSQGGGWSSPAHDDNSYDSDCGRAYVEVQAAGDACTEAIACSDQKVLSLANNAGNPGEGTQYAVGLRAAELGGPVQSIFTLDKNLTYELDVFKTGHNRYGGIVTIAETDLRKNGSFSLFSSADGRGLAVRVGRSSKEKQCTGNCREYTLDQEIPTGRWTHVAVTVANGTTLTWYINGTKVKQQTLAGWDVSATPRRENVKIGDDEPGAPEYINAQLDEVRIWNVARSESEIRANMNKKLAGNEPGLVNYWNFDGGSTSDLTGHTQALQLKNGASVTADPATSNPLKFCARNICDVCAPLSRQVAFSSADSGITTRLTFNPNVSIQIVTDPVPAVSLTGTNSSWAAPASGGTWISYRSDSYTGNDATGNGKGPANGSQYTFTQRITVPANAQITGGSITFAADNRIRSIKLNDQAILTQPAQTVCDSAHSDYANLDRITFDATQLGFLHTGDNTLTFVVEQEFVGSTCPNHNPFGVTWGGSVQYTVQPTDPTCSPIEPPLPVQKGALRIDRFTRTSAGAVGPLAPATSLAGINSTALIDDNPAVFFQLAVGPYTPYVTDFVGEERFGLCQFPVGGSGCSPSVMNPLPASQCSGGICALPSVVVTENTMTVVAVTYEPESDPVIIPPLPPSCSDGIDNDNDNKTDLEDEDCQTPAGGVGGSGGPGGEQPPVPPSCGNNTLNAGEQCDDGNTVSGDGCSTTCTIELPPPVSCTLTATPSVIVLNIEPSKIEWSCTNINPTVHTITITDNNSALSDICPVGGSPACATSGNKFVAPDQTTRFTLTVKNASGATVETKNVTLTVTDSGGGEIQGEF